MAALTYVIQHCSKSQVNCYVLIDRGFLMRFYQTIAHKKELTNLKLPEDKAILSKVIDTDAILILIYLALLKLYVFI